MMFLIVVVFEGVILCDGSGIMMFDVKIDVFGYVCLGGIVVELEGEIEECIGFEMWMMIFGYV